jgi:hypothetical protein
MDEVHAIGRMGIEDLASISAAGRTIYRNQKPVPLNLVDYLYH